MKTRTINVLTRVRKYFPEVNKVTDAKESITVKVQKRDSLANKGKPQSCALAKACERCLNADGAIINVGFSYVIKGYKAVRYKTSPAVGREITSFDRHGDFAVGSYVLGKISPGQRLGARTPKPRGPHIKKRKPETVLVHRHHTDRIRVSGNGFH